MSSDTNQPVVSLSREQILAGEPIPRLNHGFLRYVAHMGDDLTPLEAARMSTGNPTGVDAAKDAATRDYLWRHAHATPFEMTALQLEVQCPLFVAREWMRHRVPFSYNEYSQRYSEALDLYYVPTEERVRQAGQSSTNKQGSGEPLADEVVYGFLNSVDDEQETQRDIYSGYLESGIARELARINMPVSNFTRFRVQSNLRGWFNFLNLRMRENAQYEIRVYAEAIAHVIELLWPETWAVFEEHTLEAASLSFTERQILSRILRTKLEASELDQLIGDARSSSQVREFKAKLMLD